VPTTSEITIVAASTGMSPDRLMPIDSKPTLSICTRPRPPAMPTAEPTSPTTAACTRIEVKTCSGEAPTARSSANSRIRCRTDIAKVLEMMNAPTNSAIAANTSRNVVTKPSICPIASLLSCRTSSPVATSTDGSSSAAPTRSTSCCCVTPSAP
jgi:hypothetical protein